MVGFFLAFIKSQISLKIILKFSPLSTIRPFAGGVMHNKWTKNGTQLILVK